MSVVSIRRTENKYLLNSVQAERLKTSLDIVLSRDPHCLERPYEVTSLYFDSLDNADLYQKLAGTHRRKKIRLRYYGTHDQTVKLEAKRKVGDLQGKDSVLLTRDEALRLARGDLSVLSVGRDPDSKALRIYSEMRLGCYRPVCQIMYERMAWTHPQHNLRVTLDSRIRFSESDLVPLSDRTAWQAATWSSVVLEVKCDGRPPSFVSDALRPYHLTRLAVSKYCLCRPVRLEFEW